MKILGLSIESVNDESEKVCRSYLSDGVIAHKVSIVVVLHELIHIILVNLSDQILHFLPFELISVDLINHRFCLYDIWHKS